METFEKSLSKTNSISQEDIKRPTIFKKPVISILLNNVLLESVTDWYKH